MHHVTVDFNAAADFCIYIDLVDVNNLWKSLLSSASSQKLSLYQSCPWVGSTRGLSWVGSIFCTF